MQVQALIESSKIGCDGYYPRAILYGKTIACYNCVMSRRPSQDEVTLKFHNGGPPRNEHPDFECNVDFRTFLDGFDATVEPDHGRHRLWMEWQDEAPSHPNTQKQVLRINVYDETGTRLLWGFGLPYLLASCWVSAALRHFVVDEEEDNSFSLSPAKALKLPRGGLKSLSPDAIVTAFEAIISGHQGAHRSSEDTSLLVGTETFADLTTEQIFAYLDRLFAETLTLDKVFQHLDELLSEIRRDNQSSA